LVADCKQGQGYQLKSTAAPGFDFEVLTAEQLIIYVVYLFSYSTHVEVAVSSPFAATKEGFQLVEVCS